jgi:hypothetical protein
MDITNVTYVNTDEKVSTQKSLFTEKQSKNDSILTNIASDVVNGPNTNEIYANQDVENMQLRMQLTETERRVGHEELDDYDHLHGIKEEMTSTTEDVYSHMTNNQNRVTSTGSDVYSHMANNKNRVTSTSSDLYSHMTNNQNTMTATSDDMYSHMDGYISEEIIPDNTYDHAERVDSEYGDSQIVKNASDTYDHA